MHTQKSFREAPEKYWNLESLQDAPSWHPSGFSDSHWRGLQDILFDGVPVNGVKSPVFAYVGKPDGPAPVDGFPGIVLIHGGGGTAFPEYIRLWISYGYAVIAIDWYNRRPAIRNSGQGGEEQLDLLELPGGTRRNHLANVSNMILAHSLLRSLPDVNPDRIGFVGLSWGSWYGAMVAAVDDRFKFVLEIYCGDCNPQSEDFINGRFLHAAKVPMYWIASTNDHNVTPESLQRGFEECSFLWNKSLVVDLPHSHVGFTFPVCRRVADCFLRNGTPLPVLGKPHLESGILSAGILSVGNGIRNAVLCYTTDRMENTTWKRVWHKLPADISENRIFARLPEAAAQAFLSAYDEESPFDDCCGSTDLVILKK